MSGSKSGTRSTARLRRPQPAAVPEGQGRLAARRQLLGAGLLLTLLWAVVLGAMAEVFAWGLWFPRALTITTATVTAAWAARAIRPRRRITAGLYGGLAGLACWSWWFATAGRSRSWWEGPVETLAEIRDRIIGGSAPLSSAGPIEDVLLLAVLLAALVTVLVFVGLGHPLLAGVCTSLLLLIPSAVTGVTVGWLALCGAGVLLALLAWLGAPAADLVGAISAVVSVAVAAGLMAAAPPARDRVWNDSLFPAPVSDSVPDVTIALADDLRERSGTRAFTFTSTRPGSHRFALATLAEFDGGRWQPQDAPNDDGLTVLDARTPAVLPPEAFTPPGDAPASSVTVTVDGLLSSWLPLPQSTVRVTPSDEPGGFDPAQWRWADAANTGRAETNITRRDDQYTAETYDLPVLAAQANPESLTDATRLITGPGESPEMLAPYLDLPDGLPASIAEAAERVGGGADDRLAVGSALQDWFRGGDFLYDESAPYEPGTDPNDSYAVMESLLTEQRGFCVHYASTFAVMTRHLGAPARVVVGYAARAVGDEETVVRGRELHAWPEIYVDDVGWVAFEPTPGGAGVRSDTNEDVPATPEPDSMDDQAETPDPAPQALPPETAPEFEEPADQGERAQADDGLPAAIVVLGWAIAALVMALIMLPGATRRFRGIRRRRSIERGDRPAERAWAELHDTATDFGLFAADERPAPRARTAEAQLEHLENRGALHGEAAVAARSLVSAMVEERYGAGERHGTRDDRPDANIGGQLDLAVRALRSSAARPARLRAGWFPRSAFRPHR